MADWKEEKLIYIREQMIYNAPFRLNSATCHLDLDPFDKEKRIGHLVRNDVADGAVEVERSFTSRSLFAVLLLNPR